MSGSRGKCRYRRIAPRFKLRREPRRRSRRMPEPNSGDRCSRGCRLVRFLDRKIAARLPTRYPRRVEWRMIPDYRDFTIGSVFKGTDQSPARSALLTANWHGCEAPAILAGDEGLTGLALRLQRIEFLLEPLFRGDRPALQRLLADITAGRIDIVVVYKIDRLTRSLTDFAKIVEILDTEGASFVSVTHQFNTTGSMGRLTLNVLLSFAQFEREVIGERIRDKIAASKKKGMWMGGVPPLGYRVENHKLVVIDSEAETVRFIFRRYAELGSVRLLKNELDAKGIQTKLR